MSDPTQNLPNGSYDQNIQTWIEIGSTNLMLNMFSLKNNALKRSKLDTSAVTVNRICTHQKNSEMAKSWILVKHGLVDYLMGRVDYARYFDFGPP